jgi:hypothetical protein
MGRGVTRARNAGCRARCTFHIASIFTVTHPPRANALREAPATPMAPLAPTAQSSTRAATLRLLRQGHWGTPMRDFPLFTSSASCHTGASTGVEPVTHGLRGRCSTTELPCWRSRPRPRAVRASAIRSASAPGRTREPAPLTRFPSQPRYDAAPARGIEFFGVSQHRHFGCQNDETPINTADRGLFGRLPGRLVQPSEHYRKGYYLKSPRMPTPPLGSAHAATCVAERSVMTVDFEEFGCIAGAKSTRRFFVVNNFYVRTAVAAAPC